MATMKKLRPWIPVIVCALVAAGLYARERAADARL